MSVAGRKFFRRDEVVGKDVYDSDLRKIGSVSDLAFSSDAKPAVVVSKQDKSEEIVPLELVDRLGDIVLLKVNRLDAVAQAPAPRPTQTETTPTGSNRICIKCGAVNPITARFCTKCRNQFF